MKNTFFYRILPVAAPFGSTVTLNEQGNEMSHLAGVPECQLLEIYAFLNILPLRQLKKANLKSCENETIEKLVLRLNKQ